MRLMRNGDPSLFYKFFRMSPATFDFLHSLVEEGLTKEWLCREPVSSGERLAITLRCVCHSFASAGYILGH